MKQLLSRAYIPFGAQYYRAPSPKPEEWERDLREMAALGFNSVKFWIQWRWNEPAEGRYDFSDIDRLMALAERFGLRVMLNTIVDVAPAWIYKKYPDASMLTLDNRKVGPQTQPHRQIGGLGVCFNNQNVMRHLFAFLKKAVGRYASHPALEFWNVASEPELTSSMAELRLYADDVSKMNDMLCYCHHCEQAFRRWLKSRYKTITALNHSWNRNYRSFGEVELPKTRNTFNDLIDWRMFFVDTLGEHVGRRFSVARAADKRRHALMCHHVFIQGFPVTSTASDPWNVGRFGDLHGFTQMDDPMMSDILRSCAKGRPVISAEMLMLFGYTLDLPRPITIDDIKRFIFTGIAANQKGFLFWQYRPETLGREAPCWGLTTLDGSPTPRLEAFGEVNRVLQTHAEFLLDAAPPDARAAILYNPENQIFAWASTGSEATATDSLLGAHKALYERNFRVDFVHPKEINEGILSRYEVLYIPFPYHLRKELCEALRMWVHDGGTLVSEAYTAAWNVEEGAHSTIVPGGGLDAVFGVQQVDASPIKGEGDAFDEIVIEKDLAFCAAGTVCRGEIVKEMLRTIDEGVEILARFRSGEPAVTRRKFGKGEAILLASYLALACTRRNERSNADLLASFAESRLGEGRPRVSNGKRVRIDTLSLPMSERKMVIARNLEEEDVAVSVTLPEKQTIRLKEEFSGKIKDVTCGEFTLTLHPREVQVYYSLCHSERSEESQT